MDKDKTIPTLSQTTVSSSAYKLDSIKIDFRQGYSYNETKDRYEGIIKFSNGEQESFQFKIREDLAQPYIDLIAKDIVKAANDLGNRLILSLGLSSE
jgi:hypothetical protein